MAEQLPLLVFPNPRVVPPPSGHGFPSGSLHVPSRGRQTERLSGQLQRLEQDFSHYRATVGATIQGLEPESVIVIEVVGSVDDFRVAAENTEGLEWLGEWELDEEEADSDFYIPPKIGSDFFRKHLDEVTDREQSKRIRQLLIDAEILDSDGRLAVETLAEDLIPDGTEVDAKNIVAAIEEAKTGLIGGRLFLSFLNQRGLNELLSLWGKWSAGKDLPTGKKRWQDVFSQARNIRRWSVQESLEQTGMVDVWRTALASTEPTEWLACQVELFYRRDETTRATSARTVRMLVENIGGKVIAPVLDIPEIGLHAMKIRLASDGVRTLLREIEDDSRESSIRLFTFPGVMYFRPTGQSITAANSNAESSETFPATSQLLPPVAAVIDGVPNVVHGALNGRVILDDPDNLTSEYQPGEKRHGTAITSVVVYGAQRDAQVALNYQVYHAAVLQADPRARRVGDFREYVPEEAFLEDRIHRAVRRMFEGEGDVEPQAPRVKIVNLSIGDSDRPFMHAPSPLSRLLDWLSWRYRVLFCVSAGNYYANLDLGNSAKEFDAFPDEKKIHTTLVTMQKQLFVRRLIAPAEAINALTIGALHSDQNQDGVLGQRIDILPCHALPSPISRFGHGFRRSIKPEIYLPGGRQLYTKPPGELQSIYRLSAGSQPPGQFVAWDDGEIGGNPVAYIRGTSVAAALATRGAIHLVEGLSQLRTLDNEEIPDEYISVLTKALLVHGARQSREAVKYVEDALKHPGNSRRFKQVLSRYLGYGVPDIDYAISCTQQRATVIGYGKIRENEVHEFRFPLPLELSGASEWRRMIITLGWFSPINPNHRHLREAKLSVSPSQPWGSLPISVHRMYADHNQVQRGTVQHEVLEGEEQVSEYHDGEDVVLQVKCAADATNQLDEMIPYGLVVTLELSENSGVQIYEAVRARVQTKVAVGAQA